MGAVHCAAIVPDCVAPLVMRRTPARRPESDLRGALVTPLLRFHLRAGVRLALRAAAPAVGLPVAALTLQHDPAGAAAGLAAWLVAPPGQASSSLVVAILAIALAAWAVPRVTTGMGGWFRHLPVTETARRRSVLAALTAAESPVLVAWLLAGAVAAHQSVRIAPGRLAAVLVMMCAAALLICPAAHVWRTAPPALAAIVLAASARNTGILAACVLIVASERMAGPLVVRSGAARRRARRPIPTPLLIGVRALGRSIVTAPILALLPLAAMALFRNNNPDITAGVAAGAARLGGGLGCAIVINALLERLVARRPAWSWARSLPEAAARRVEVNAILIGAPCVVPIVVTAWMDVWAAATVALCVPALALRAAGALTRTTGTKMGPSGPVLAESALVASWVALLPWLAVAALAAAPLARRAAAEEDRRQRVSRWEERRHANTGDPLSWTAR